MIEEIREILDAASTVPTLGVLDYGFAGALLDHVKASPEVDILSVIGRADDKLGVSSMAALRLLMKHRVQTEVVEPNLGQTFLL
ncbi:hypothetical protein Asppvi_003448 [Aspergillus pseudoviridinutans]|uniref:Uncharacterized protein n=1 Tax=Aspergillus pseudoviridinutans TaxID=1517512 RepID=A0A9P3B8D6_9EURO|nr:uncharacterized protein Asppvi_003448 [Aspergillus pseudoviridinutans]GIJ84600.1 hypothetical protein Asppvi_003448 [Aspergillus pseudoviridinutans]